MNNSNTQHIIRDQWNQWAESWYLRYRTDEAIAKIINDPASAFHPVTYALIREAFPSLQGKRVCVPSSGDNHAVYAFHLLGAQVTSCDISEKQIASSAAIASKHGWEIEFLVEDTMRLGSVADEAYDLVYTSNGVHVWIHDLKAMYRNVRRILKDGGSSIMFDILLGRRIGRKCKSAVAGRARRLLRLEVQPAGGIAAVVVGAVGEEPLIH